MEKYISLYRFLSKRTSARMTLTFAEIERIIGSNLPESARKYSAWWSNSHTNAHPHSRSWLNAGYKTADVANGISSEQMVFIKS
jgi:hypothetical protein